MPVGLGTRVERERLQELADRSGGSAFFPADVTELTAEYQKILDELRRRYAVGYQSSNRARNGQWRKVVIRVTATGRHRPQPRRLFRPRTMTTLLAFLRRPVLIFGVCSALAMTCARERSGPAQQRLYQRSGAHFAVMFEGPADEAVAFRALEMLEAAYYRIGSALNVYPDQPVEVVLHTLEQFRDVTKSPAWAAGVYDGRIRVPIKDADRSPEQLAEVLAHEYTHAIVATLAGRSAPTWLNEGLAGVMEPNGSRDEIEALGARRRQDPAVEARRRRLAACRASRCALAYAQSASAVQRLIQLRGAAGRGVAASRAQERHAVRDRVSIRAWHEVRGLRGDGGQMTLFGRKVPAHDDPGSDQARRTRLTADAGPVRFRSSPSCDRRRLERTRGIARSRAVVGYFALPGTSR